MKVELARWLDEIKIECDVYKKNMELFYPISRQAISYVFDDPIFQQNMSLYFSLGSRVTEVYTV